jgi:hypothetical protein
MHYKKCVRVEEKNIDWQASIVLTICFVLCLVSEENILDNLIILRTITRW